jgi:RNA polymerase sigma-70 factor (ECF subfamily)
VAVKRSRTEWEAELQRHHVSSFGWALACARWNRAEAEEVLQMAYVKVLEGSARFGGESSFKTWLFGVISRTAAERRRRARVRRFALARFGTPEPRPAAGSPEREAGAAQEQGRLVAALAELSPRQREVLHLVFYGDLTIEQAARVMGVSVGSARTHYSRGKDRLRGLLEEVQKP